MAGCVSYRLAILAPLLSLGGCALSLECTLCTTLCTLGPEGWSEVGVVGGTSLSRGAETRRPTGAGRVGDAVDELTKSERRGISRRKRGRKGVDLGKGADSFLS